MSLKYDKQYSRLQPTVIRRLSFEEQLRCRLVGQVKCVFFAKSL